jgi:hypothetical protein
MKMSGLEPYITRKRHPGRLEGPPPRTPNFRAPTVKTTFGTGPAQGKVEGDVDELESYTSTMRQAAPMVRTENTPPPIAPTAASRGRGRGASRGGRIENLQGRGSFGRGRGVGASRGGSRGSITNFSARGSSVSSRGFHVPNFPPYLPSLPSAGYRGGSIMSATGGPSSNGSESSLRRFQKHMGTKEITLIKGGVKQERLRTATQILDLLVTVIHRMIPSHTSLLQDLPRLYSHTVDLQPMLVLSHLVNLDHSLLFKLDLTQPLVHGRVPPMSANQIHLPTSPLTTARLRLPISSLMIMPIMHRSSLAIPCKTFLMYPDNTELGERMLPSWQSRRPRSLVPMRTKSRLRKASMSCLKAYRRHSLQNPLP